ncbi:zinc transport system substrate-binding protein [Paenibacillus sp. UNCCL117]|uniref:metal ABC transporter substrate-binding protein n=1 Tax=unclassified Paenibacillus TaxID=185978 RepID=UPI000883B5F4|nr:MULTISPECIES: zinc ABC transporter substrate-binding protein [unclassified Paenibacillus]SDD42830.1 zinc transport system substrate-binding protein [Paenibacillus sp. cl123]SFW47520.1 zinc transport system substrate-binding protein [Paenibacillus sp. UNCCL117]
MLRFFSKGRFLLSAISIAALVMALSACGQSKATLAEGKVNVVTSFYPLYDFASAIGGEHVNVINLVPTGVEPHDWSPKSRDIQNITNAELFVYLGAGFEGWVHDTLDSMKSDAKVQVVEASRGITLIEAGEDDHEHEEHGEEKKDGHGDEKEAKEGHDHDHDHGSHDPHVWLSPLNAKQMALTIKDALVQADAAHKAEFEANYAKLAGKLDALHNRYKTELAATSKKEIVVTHQSFGYLAKEYGLTQKAIMGMSPDAEPTSKEMKSILQFIKDNQVNYIFFEELVSDKLAATIAKDAGAQTLVLSPIEGLTEEQLAKGDNYVSLMENNLNNLLKALK